MTEAPLRFVEYAVTLAEAPKEVSLTIAVSNCAFRCSGCHSPYLWEDKGELLLPALPGLIRRYAGLISCVSFMGEGQNLSELLQALEIVRRFG